MLKCKRSEAALPGLHCTSRRPACTPLAPLYPGTRHSHAGNGALLFCGAACLRKGGDRRMSTLYTPDLGPGSWEGARKLTWHPPGPAVPTVLCAQRGPVQRWGAAGEGAGRAGWRGLSLTPTSILIHHCTALQSADPCICQIPHSPLQTMHLHASPHHHPYTLHCMSCRMILPYDTILSCITVMSCCHATLCCYWLSRINLCSTAPIAQIVTAGVDAALLEELAAGRKHLPLSHKFPLPKPVRLRLGGMTCTARHCLGWWFHLGDRWCHIHSVACCNKPSCYVRGLLLPIAQHQIKKHTLADLWCCPTLTRCTGPPFPLCRHRCLADPVVGQRTAALPVKKLPGSCTTASSAPASQPPRLLTSKAHATPRLALPTISNRKRQVARCMRTKQHWVPFTVMRQAQTRSLVWRPRCWL